MRSSAPAAAFAGRPHAASTTRNSPTTSGSYTALYLAGSDTVGVEQVTESAALLQGDLRVRGQPRIRWEQALAEPAGVRTLRLFVWQPGAGVDATPVQQLELQVRGDSAYVYTAPAAGAARGAPQAVLPAHSGAAWMVSQSVVHGAWVAQQASGDTVWVVLSTGARQFAGTVARQGATTAFTLAGTTMQFQYDGNGALQSAGVPAQGVSLRIVRGTEGAALGAAAAAEATAPLSYDAPADAPYTASTVRIPTAMGHTLVGTLTMPRAASGPVPAIVTITGSGPQERDERIAGVEGYGLFRQVADTLGRRGIAVLRLDDRGVGASEGDFASATSQDFANDVRAAVSWLRTQPNVDSTRIGLVGHSEGGLIAPMVAADDTRIAAIALLAGPAYNGARIIAFQQRSAIAQSHAASFASVRDSLFRVAQQQLDSTARTSPWIREFLQYDPVPTARRVRAPVLLLQGDTDLQVTPEQADTLAAAFRTGGNRRVRMHRLRQTNHLFQRDPSGLPSGYGTLPDRRATNDSLGLLADWLVETLGPVLQ
jgi:uncharacterized protein